MKKKILMIDDWAYFMGGGQVYFYNLVSELDKSIFEPVIMLPDHGGELLEKIKLHRIKTYTYTKSSFYNIHTFIKTILKTVSVCKKEEIDLIHINPSATAASFSSLITAKVLNLPSIWQVHIPERSFLRDRILSILADKIVPISEYALENRFSFLKNSTKLQTVLNGVDIESFSKTNESSWRKSNNISRDTVLIGTLGQLHPIKGQEYLIKAFAHLKKSHKNIMLAFSGKDISANQSYSKTLKVLIDLHKLQNDIIIKGWTDNPSDFINALDIVVIPSVSDHMPLAILEAMACSKPIVASKIGAIPEAIGHNVTGKLVAPGNPEELFNALKDLINNEELRKLLGQNARQKAEKLFSIKNNVKQIESLYKQILNL